MNSGQDSHVGDDGGAINGGARARLAFMLVAAVLCAVVIVATGLEWGSLSVHGRLVVSETGTGDWQGLVALAAAIAGLLVIGVATARGRGRPAALAALIAGLAVLAAAVLEVVHLVTRPTDIAETVRAGAAAIPLKGYRVPLIESAVGAGTWVALLAGVLLALAGLAGLVIPAWRARR